jgi:hypothetical protein
MPSMRAVATMPPAGPCRRTVRNRCFGVVTASDVTDVISSAYPRPSCRSITPQRPLEHVGPVPGLVLKPKRFESFDSATLYVATAQRATYQHRRSVRSDAGSPEVFVTMLTPLVWSEPAPTMPSSSILASLDQPHHRQQRDALF